MKPIFWMVLTIAFTFILIAAFICEAVYREEIMAYMGVQINIQLQKQFGRGKMEIFEIFSSFITLLILTAILVIQAFFVGKKNFFINLLTIAHAYQIANFLQLCTKGPRPFWISTEVETYDCSPAEFGMPSEHMIIVLIICHGLIEYIFFHKVIKNWKWYNQLLFILICLCLITYYCFVSLSRIVLGKHFLIQVLFGFLVAIYCIQFYWKYGRQLLRKQLLNTVWYFENSFAFLIVPLLYLALLCIPIIIVQTQRTNDPQYVNYLNTILKHCPNEVYSLEDFGIFDLVFTGLLQAYLGFYLASIIIWKYCRNVELSFEWKLSVWWKKIIMLIIILCIAFSWFLFYLIPFGNSIVKYFFALSIPSFLCLFILKSFIPYIFLKLGLVEDHEDIVRKGYDGRFAEDEKALIKKK